MNDAEMRFRLTLLGLSPKTVFDHYRRGYCELRRTPWSGNAPG